MNSEQKNPKGRKFAELAKRVGVAPHSILAADVALDPEPTVASRRVAQTWVGGLPGAAPGRVERVAALLDDLVRLDRARAAGVSPRRPRRHG